MAKRFVKISLATKLRVLLSAAVLGIIAAALVVPWYFMELLAEQGVQRPGAELTRLKLNEFRIWHTQSQKPNSPLVNLYTAGQDVLGRKGPIRTMLTGGQEEFDRLDDPTRDAVRAFLHNPDQELAVLRTEDEVGRAVYRCFRAVRNDAECHGCHKDLPDKQFQPGQLVGVLDVTIPAAAASGPLVWWTRGAFITGVLLAGLLAFFLFALITHRLILRPVHQLRNLTASVAEGDLSVRSEISTGDELQHLGESFNDMLNAIASQHERLQSANEALDQKLMELAEANVTLYEANKVKSEFLANISHELRTPLNSIIGFADLLAGHENDRVQRYGSNIRSSAKTLLGMINDLLDLAKIEAGKAEVRVDKLSVSDTCQSLAALMQPLAKKKHIHLVTEIANDLPIVTTDPGKFQQILYNLLSNALKFTPAAGTVTLTARALKPDKNAPPNEVFVAVADTGPGIAEVDQQRIFDKFYQADRSLTKEIGGTGLGLAISKELANLIGGKLTLKSSPGHGAEFSIIIPLVYPVASTASENAAKA